MTQEHEIVAQEQAEAADDMGDWAIEQDEATLEQRLAAGRLQCRAGGVL